MPVITIEWLAQIFLCKNGWVRPKHVTNIYIPPQMVRMIYFTNKNLGCFRKPHQKLHTILQ